MEVRLSKLQLGIYGEYEPIRCAVSNDYVNASAVQFSLGDNHHYVLVNPTHAPKVSDELRQAWRDKVKRRQAPKTKESD